jgi:large subunit ribosomal protein L10
MGKTFAQKDDLIAELKTLLDESQLAFVIDYKGLSVSELGDLRTRLRTANATCKIAKNTLMRIAVEGNENWQPMQGLLKESSAFLLVGENVSGAVKAYKEFQKASKKTEIRGGVMEGKALTKAQVEAIGDLPTKDQLYAQIAGALNAITTKIAVGVKEVPNSLARGIKAVSEKDAA